MFRRSISQTHSPEVDQYYDGEGFWEPTTGPDDILKLSTVVLACLTLDPTFSIYLYHHFTLRIQQIHILLRLVLRGRDMYEYSSKQEEEAINYW